MDCSTPGFPVLHYLPEFAQAHVHWVGDTIQPSHPLPPSFAFNLTQHQVYPMTWLFTSGGIHVWTAVKATSTGPSWTVVELLGGCDLGLGHFLTFSSIISSCKEDKLLFCFLEGKKAPKGRALRFTVWKKAWKMTMQTRPNVYFQCKSSSQTLWKAIFANLLYNEWMRL